MKKYTRIYILLSCLILFLSFILVSYSTAASLVVSADKVMNKHASLPIIVIDPGHGGEDGGAKSDNGLLEKDLNLEISLYLKAFFEQSGFSVIMTRSTDKAIYDSSSNTLREKKRSDLKNRLEICNGNDNNVYISIHQNKFEQSKYWGTQVFYSNGNGRSKILAEYIQNTVKNTLQPRNERKTKAATNDIYLLKNAKVPCVLIECGFLSNKNDVELLMTNSYQKSLAYSIYCGFLEYYNN